MGRTRACTLSIQSGRPASALVGIPSRSPSRRSASKTRARGNTISARGRPRRTGRVVRSSKQFCRMSRHISFLPYDRTEVPTEGGLTLSLSSIYPSPLPRPAASRAFAGGHRFLVSARCLLKMTSFSRCINSSMASSFQRGRAFGLVTSGRSHELYSISSGRLQRSQCGRPDRPTSNAVRPLVLSP